jgi:transposase
VVLAEAVRMRVGFASRRAVMQAYSMDLRERVMADVDTGMKTKDVAEKYHVSADWVRKLKRFRRETGSFAARQQRVSHATKLDAELPHLEALIASHPDATLRELRDGLSVQVSVSTVWRATRRLRLTFKKKSSMRRSSNAPTFKRGEPPGE